MVVCKCRKATKLYCFVHKVPVCGECICFPEHRIFVVRTYTEWVIDGEDDWPKKCCHCQAELEEGTDPQTTRLGCLHIIHTSCLVSHIKSFPPHPAPAGYICPACSTSAHFATNSLDHCCLFWSSALPTLPVTAPPPKDVSHSDDASEGRVRHHRSSRLDPRKLLLIIAITNGMTLAGSFILHNGGSANHTATFHREST